MARDSVENLELAFHVVAEVLKLVLGSIAEVLERLLDDVLEVDEGEKGGCGVDAGGRQARCRHRQRPWRRRPR